MTHALFPLAFANDDLRILTGLILGFFFGFSLERAGFGNARKLAAQFYGYDMAVFKVMFSAILVAMVGLYTFVRLGWMDLSLLFINPTFMWAQVVGGFLLGAGFLISGLCPGTSVVSAASGRWDALVAFLGIAFGALVFIVAVDWLPPLEALYNAGTGEVSLLQDVFGLPPLVLALLIVVGAGAAFVGAEKVERHFQARYGVVELAPADRPFSKFAFGGAVAAVGVLALAIRAPAPAAQPVEVAALSPLALARDLIEGEAGMMVLDLRAPDTARGERIPGSYPAADPNAALNLLAAAPEGALVVLVGDDGTAPSVPTDWPRTVRYAYVEGGASGWRQDVLTPLPAGATLQERAWSDWQNQVSAYFSGAAVQAAATRPPPPMALGGPHKKKKKGGGC